MDFKGYLIKPTMDLVVYYRTNKSYNSMYRDRYLHDVINSNRVNILISPMGTGKTACIMNDIDWYIIECDDVIIISTRRSYSKNINKKIKEISDDIGRIASEKLR